MVAFRSIGTEESKRRREIMRNRTDGAQAQERAKRALLEFFRLRYKLRNGLAGQGELDAYASEFAEFQENIQYLKSIAKN